jgi:hypothetical protein
LQRMASVSEEAELHGLDIERRFLHQYKEEREFPWIASYSEFSTLL